MTRTDHSRARGVRALGTTLALVVLFGCAAHAADTVVEGTTTSGADAGVLAIRYRCDGLDCAFEAVLFGQLSEEATDFRWQFGDGSVVTATDPMATHTFATPGAQSVALSVHDRYCDLFVAEAEFTLPSDGGSTLPELALGTTDPNDYGYRFEGVNGHREALEMRFAGSSSDLVLDLTGFDIDIKTEVRAFVNGTPIGYLARTDDNGRGPSRLEIPASALSASGNTLRFEPRTPGWRWGVTDLRLSVSGGQGASPELALGTTDPNDYGYRFEGVNGHREALEMRFAGSSSDLVLDLTGFDIDIKTEVRAFVNGTPIGYLARTDDNGRGPSRLEIPASALSASGNTLRFEPRTPGWRWGVTDLRLSVSGGGGGA